MPFYFFIINFSIFSNLVLTIGTSFGDRLLYSASPAFAMALALGLIKLFDGDKTNTHTNFSISNIFDNKKIWAAATVILILYSYKTITRNQVWGKQLHLI